MIEPTDEQMNEMIAAADQAIDRELGYLHRPQADALRVIICAVLAIVARDRCMEARGHVCHPLAARCGDRGFAGSSSCRLAPGHEGGHDYGRARP